ncbi:MAG TPA: polysaccharide biosynthesis C-terminal domain-containing protein, partial [Flavobacteriales bacterium]|nr:polysaccharide biosynthesis C-terminal domain-containing protein [Flavobacteriales bacterium]
GSKVPKRLRSSMQRYAMFTLGGGLAAVGFGSVDQLMLGAMLRDGLAYVAVYAVSIYMATLILIPARSLVLPSMPLLASAWRRRDHKTIATIYHRSVSIQLVIGAYLFLCLWSSSDLLYTFMKPGYDIGRSSMLIIGVANVIALASGLSGSIVATSRSYWFDAMSGVALILLSAGFDFVLIKHMGFVGAAWSTLIAFTAVSSSRVYFLRKRYGLWPYDNRTIWTAALALALGVALWLMPTIGDVWMNAIVRVLLITVPYWLVVHRLRIAPELADQALKVLGRSRS